MEAKQTVRPQRGRHRKVLEFLDALEEHEDVQRVYSNADFDEAQLEALGLVFDRMIESARAAAVVRAALARTATGCSRSRWHFSSASLVWFSRSVNDFFGRHAATCSTPAFAGQTEGDAISECVAAAHPLLGGRAAAERTVSARRRDGPAARRRAAHVREGRAGLARRLQRLAHLPDARPALRIAAQRRARPVATYSCVLDGTKTVPNNDVPADHVVDQDPPPLTSAREGTDVDARRSAKGRRPASRCRTSSA